MRIEESLPASLDSERLILGSVFTTERAMDTLRSTIDGDDFSLVKHRRIWARMCDLYDAGTPVDRITVTHALMQHAELPGVGGIEYVTELEDGLPPIVNLDSFIYVLKEKTALRQIMITAHNIVLRCMAGGETAEAIRESVASMAADSVRRPNAGPVSMADLIREIGLDEIMSPRREQGIRLPWSRLNGAIGGLRGCQMVVLAAHTGRGKTSAALQIAVHAARQGAVPLIWTLEMSPRQLCQRALRQMLGGKASADQLTFEDRQSTRDALAWIGGNPLYFDQHSRSVPSLCANIRRVGAERKVGLVVVDYLQLIRTSGRIESRAHQVSEQSRALKLAAMDFGIPFLVLSQFRRPDKDRPSGIHDLKESGDIENDADVILLFNSGEIDAHQETPVSVHIGKQREGPAGFDVPLVFHPTSQTFYSPED